MGMSKSSRMGRPKAQETMKVVGIRLQDSLIDRLKLIASTEGLPYQTYLRKIVWDHVAKKERSLAK